MVTPSRAMTRLLASLFGWPISMRRPYFFAVAADLAECGSGAVEPAACDLVDHLVAIDDPRQREWREHPVAVVPRRGGSGNALVHRDRLRGGRRAAELLTGLHAEVGVVGQTGFYAAATAW